MNATLKIKPHFAARLRPLMTALTLASLSLITLFTALRANPPTVGPFPIVTVILKDGDTPAGGGGRPVTTLNPPVTNGSGRVAFSGSLDNDTEFLWYDTALIWLSTTILSDVNSIEDVIGISDNGNYALSLNLNPGSIDSLWTDEGLLLAEGDPAPANPGYFITSLSRATMPGSGTVNWFSELSDTPGGPSQFEVLYHASDIATPIIAPLLQGGAFISGFTIGDTGLDPDYFVSDNGSHFITFVQTTEPFTQDGFIYLDGLLPLREGDPTGDGDAWSNFDLFQVNNSGDYLVSGDTNGAATSDEFIAYNGHIQVREGDTTGGITLSSSATVQQLSLNNLGQAATIWRILSGQEILFFACDASDLTAATAILATGDQVDTDGDGTADATLTDFNTASAAQSFSLAEDGKIYVEAGLDFGIGPLEAVISLVLPGCNGNPNPGLQVDPLSLASTQTIDTLVTKTLSLSNTGSLSLSWAIGHGPLITYANGPLINLPGGGPDGADASILQDVSQDMEILGFNNGLDNSFRLADDFTITDTDGWSIDSLTFYAYQTGSTLNSTMTAVNLRLWDGPPNLQTSTVLFGDTTTNRLLQTNWTGVYRIPETIPDDDTRPIMANTVAANTFLPPGSYWLDWQTDGTLASGPWAPPIAISNVITTGNSLQLIGGVWSPVTDTDSNNNGTHAPQGFPFQVTGHVSNCQQPDWVTVTPDNSILAPGTADQVAVIFNATGLPPGTYTGELCFTSSDSANAFLRLPLTLTAQLPTLALTTTIGLAPDECATDTTFYAPAAITAYYCYTVTNNGDITLTLHDLQDSHFGPIFSAVAADLVPGATLNNISAGFPFSAAITTTTVTTATWTAYNPGPIDEADASDTATVIIGTPAVALTATVGTNATGCASTSSLTVAIGSNVYYCYRLTNTGDVPLTLHDLTDSIGPLLTAYTLTLAPGATFNTVAAGITRTVPIVTHTVNTAVWTASNGPLITATATTSTTVTAVQFYPLYLSFILRP